MLGVSVDLLHVLSITMEPEDGILWVYDGTEHGCCAFTDFGIENATEQLSNPAIVAYLQKLNVSERGLTAFAAIRTCLAGRSALAAQ